MLTALHLAAVLCLAATLTWSGLAKLRDPAGSAAAVTGFSVVPASWAPLLARVVPAVELLLAVGLVVSWGRGFTVFVWASVAFLLGFLVLVAGSLARGVTPPCHCFGEISAEPISRRTVARNALLVALALFAALGVRPFPGVGVTLSRMAPLQWVLVLALVGAATAITYLMVVRTRLVREVSAVRAELAQARQAPSRSVPKDIPQARVVDAAGQEVPLADLVQERAQLVLAVSPGCGACKDLVPVVPAWRQALAKELDVILISSGDRSAAESTYPGHGSALFADQHGEAFRSLRIGGTPAAVLLGTNGKVAAGPAMGAERILELVAAIIQAIGVNMMTGRAHQAQGGRPLGGEDSGEQFLPPAGHQVPDFEVLLEDGTRTSFKRAMAEFTQDGAALPVVAWRNGCTYCNEIASAMVDFSERGEVALLVNEPIASIRKQGLTGPAMSTVDVDASVALGVPGTPGGYPVKDGVLEPGGGIGGGSVLRMLRDRATRHGATEPHAPGATPAAHVDDHNHDHDHDHDHDHGSANGHRHISTAVTPLAPQDVDATRG